MNIGISTSNLYPLPVEESLARILQTGCREVEIFLNTQSETAPSYVRELRKQVDDAGARVVALHPYLSLCEPYLLFSVYDRRFRDGLALFDQMYEAAAALGASYLILHGDKPLSHLSEEESIDRFREVAAHGKPFGVALAQENVVRFRSRDPGYLRAMRDRLGDDAHFVLDLKQARRSGLSCEQVMDAMGDRICHVHISDADDSRDCLLPGQGTADLGALIRRLAANGFDGTLMLELYRDNFGDEDDLKAGLCHMSRLLHGEG